ncbi:MAG: HK97 family phage prohead protease [Alphaproteobacteria bacterium]|nr:HK97 family phage prohead protease [Alphaproteobacteria bacterium]
MPNAAVELREVKLAGKDDAMTFEGYGAVFNNIDSYGDTIQPGAFADTLAVARRSGRWPAMLMQHGGYGMGADDMTPVGIWTDMAEDGKGLYVNGTLADTPRGREAYALLKMSPRPAIDGLSIGYIAKEWTARSKPDEPRRTLKKIDLVEISLVTFPANGKARVQAVKAGEMSERELEKLLVRDAGFSRSEALALMREGAAGLKAMRDAGDSGNHELAGEIRRLIETLN